MRLARFATPLACAVALAAGAKLGIGRWGEPLRTAALPYLPCTRIAARGLAHVSAPELARAAGLAPGARLLAVEPAEVEARLLEHPWILSARVHRLPPVHLLVEVTERRPVAVAEAGAGGLRLVDPTGTRFAPAEPEHLATLPLLHGLAAEPDAAQREVAEALRVADLLAQTGLPQAAQIWLGREAAEEGLALVLRGEPARILLGSARAADGLRRLARTRAAGLAEVAAADAIDLRFAGRVVLRSRPSPGGDEVAAERGRATPQTRGRAG